MIVMLNLLITIIGETYGRIKEISELASYMEMASLICENAYLVPECVKKSYAQQGKFLICLTNVDKEESEEKKSVEDKLDSL